MELTDKEIKRGIFRIVLSICLLCLMFITINIGYDNWFSIIFIGVLFFGFIFNLVLGCLILTDSL